MGALVAQQANGFDAPSIEWWSLSPLLALLAGGLILLVVAALTPQWPRGMYAGLAALTGLVSGGLAMFQWDDITEEGPVTIIDGALAWDTFAMFLTITICIAVVLAALVTNDYLLREGQDGPEVYALYIMAAIGGIVMSASSDLIVLFLGLETLSIALYVLAASNRRRAESQESGMKYFVLGGFSSAFFLYGIALVYGATGSTRFDQIVASLSEVPVERKDALLLAGVALLLVGLGFKVSAVPFHVWSPDVYQGAPTPITAFMASASKAAAFGAMLRVLVVALPSRADDWRPVIWAVAVLTLLVGSIIAVVQTDVKRMMAYSSINHAGFILVGVEAAGHTNGLAGDGVPSAVLYLMLYSVLIIGTFAVIGLVAGKGDARTDIAAFRGLARRKPALALGLTVLLLAQAGVPLTSGFVAKFGVIRAAVEEDSYAIAIIAMVSSVIAAFLYLRVMVSVWLAEPETGDEILEPVRTPFATSVAVALAVGFTLVVGVIPGWLIDAADTVTNIATSAR